MLDLMAWKSIIPYTFWYMDQVDPPAGPIPGDATKDHLYAVFDVFLVWHF